MISAKYSELLRIKNVNIFSCLMSSLSRATQKICNLLLVHVLALAMLLSSTTNCWADLIESPVHGKRGYPQKGVYFHHQDALGNTVLLTGMNGQQVTKIAYTAYGEIDQSRSNGPDIVREKYTGQELDEDTGLYYYGARYYDPQLGIFITPEADQEFFNPYLYAGNDPASSYDQGGQFVVTLAKSIGGFLTRHANKIMTGLSVAGGAYTTTASINGSWNPGNWDWSLGSGTYAALFIGGAIGYVTGGIGGDAVGYNKHGGPGADAGFTNIPGGSKKPSANPVPDTSGATIGGPGKAFTNSNLDGGGPAGTAGVDNPKCRTSFPAGTLVAIKDKLVPIETIKLGDQVWAYNEKVSKAELAKIESTISRYAQKLVEIQIANEIIQTTPEHPFWVEGRGWVEAKDLKAKYELKTQSNTKVKITQVTYTQKSTPVYNFSVAQLHNYYVGKNKILVHNPKAKTVICQDTGEEVSVARKNWPAGHLDRMWDRQNKLDSNKDNPNAAYILMGANGQPEKWFNSVNRRTGVITPTRLHDTRLSSRNVIKTNNEPDHTPEWKKIEESLKRTKKPYDRQVVMGLHDNLEGQMLSNTADNRRSGNSSKMTNNEVDDYVEDYIDNFG